MQLTRLVVIRHGRTEWNRVERFRGRADIELDEIGVRQAEAAAERLSTWPIKAVYTSPLKRAFTTASVLAKRLGLEPAVLPEIIDIDYGDWQGLTPEDVSTRNHRLFSAWLTSPNLVKFPNGESLEEVRERAALAIDRIIAKHTDGTVAVVSHKVVCQIIILHLLGIDNSCFWQIAQDVCAINLFEIRDGVPSALLLNDTCHLKKILESNLG